jgi:hypothetical protein
VTEPRSDGRPMTADERTAFLAGPLIARLGCLDEDGHPYVVPTWFTHQDGGFYLVPRARAAWAGYLRRDGRVSLCIDGAAGQPNARVLVRGVAELVEEPNVGGGWMSIAREMSIRYSGPGPGLAYFEKTSAEPRWLFFVRPSRVTSWVGGWAGRYKHTAW